MNVVEESCCLQRFLPLKALPWQYVCGVGGFSQHAGYPGCRAMLQPAFCAYLTGAILQGTGKRVMSPGGEGHTQSWTGASEGVCCGQGRKVFLGMSAFVSVLYPPSLGGTCLLAIAATSATSFARLQLCLSLLPACVPKGSKR